MLSLCCVPCEIFEVFCDCELSSSGPTCLSVCLSVWVCLSVCVSVWVCLGLSGCVWMCLGVVLGFVGIILSKCLCFW